MMKTMLGATTALVVGTLTAQAGGIDRSRIAYSALFEAGRYIELGFSNVQPDVTGTYTGAAAALGTQTGNMAGSYTNLSFAYKSDINDSLSYAVFINTPYGADSAYSQGLYNGLTATWDSQQIAAVLKYKFDENFSVYGGLRYVESEAQITLPDQFIRAGLAAAGNPLAGLAPAGTLAYSAQGAKDGQVGVIVGAAYERPDIALRIGLTYESGVTHSFATTETFAVAGAINAAGVTTVEIPDAFTLDFQTGIAEDTLLFGSVRYAEWTVWEVRPPVFNANFNDNITDFDNNVVTWQLGLGRRLSDNLSVFARATYEKANGGIASRLAPTDGTKGFGIGATWRQDGMKITGGIEYAEVGDAVDGSGTRFEGNSAVGFGLTVGYSF
ncbi:OmpP1/FadL family transporter [Tabrizicola sp. TH137]|uniref:OmpP1/FadL family transporter n=1 Tax=Tabrizicola sp. TH137 TaxID=2067452 RepID=UPI0013047636|nr:outer membrane protein transport protein [Tabrizicola sp. TH137]